MMLGKQLIKQTQCGRARSIVNDDDLVRLAKRFQHRRQLRQLAPNVVGPITLWNDD
jgi:hypothetical protein